MWAFLVPENWGYSSLQCAELLIAVAYPVEEQSLHTQGSVLWHRGLVTAAHGLLGTAAVAHRLSYSVACGILRPGTNWCPLQQSGFLSTAPPGKSLCQPFLSVQFSSIKYMQCCATISALFISSTFSSSQTEDLYPLNSNSPFPHPMVDVYTLDMWAKYKNTGMSINLLL